jgi:AmmeMemoRadiSam system protein B
MTDHDEDLDPASALFAATVPPKPPASRLRPPKFAGRFYPEDAAEMRRLAQSFVGKPASSARALGLLLPHGPWPHTAALVGRALGHAQLEETVVVLGPSHTGRGPRAAIVCDGAFALPGGVQVPIESTLAESIRALAGLTESAEAFADDHAIEVLLPLLLAAQPRLAIVPIALNDVGVASATRIGAAVADAIVGRGGGVTIVVTTDLAHYVPRDRLAEATDGVLARVVALQEEELVDELRARQQRPGPIIETCGLGALLSFVHAARVLGARTGTTVGRTTSVEANVPGAAVAWAAVAWER